MYRVTRLNPFSWAKAYTLATLVIAVVVSVLMVIPIFTVISFAAMADENGAPALVAIPLICLFSVGGLLLFGVFVFIMALIQGTAFNWALGRMGGLEVDLALGPSYQAPALAETAPPVADSALTAADSPPEISAAEAAAEPESAPEAAVMMEAPTEPPDDPTQIDFEGSETAEAAIDPDTPAVGQVPEPNQLATEPPPEAPDVGTPPDTTTDEPPPEAPDVDTPPDTTTDEPPPWQT